MSPSQYAKAIAAFVTGAALYLQASLDSGLSTQDYIGAVLGGIVAAAAIYLTPNKAPAGRPANPDLSEQAGDHVARDAGRVDTGMLVTIVLGILVAAALLWVLTRAF